VDSHEPKLTGKDFHIGAAIYSSDGREIGKLQRLIVDKESLGLRAIVAKESRRFSGHLLSPGSFLLTDELIVPRDAVQSISHDRIDLKLSAGEVRNLAPYLGYRYGGETVAEGFGDEISVLASSPSVPFSLEEIANKQADELEIAGGENVMLGHTGKKLGTVKDVLFDDAELVGVVVLPDGILKQEVILPRRFLGRSDDLALFADLTAEEFDHLEPFEPTD
jgi:sporulation protein YlmC with PRC-barrel domain